MEASHSWIPTWLPETLISDCWLALLVVLGTAVAAGAVGFALALATARADAGRSREAFKAVAIDALRDKAQRDHVHRR